ncbi:MAG TPA: type IV secretion system protein [Rickettsiales bacterium]|nr:type IV secretion system protein [Rickettsiales bacterium]
MKKGFTFNIALIIGMVFLCLSSGNAYAACTVTNQCECFYSAAQCKAARCVSELEPNLKQVAQCAGQPGCVPLQQPGVQNTATNPNRGAGYDIIAGVFADVNGIMTDIAKNFFNGIINQPNYSTAVNAAVLLYLTIYGIMIVFNLAYHSTGEVFKRLVKIAIVWAIMSPNGWLFFSTFVTNPLIGGMNQLISQFTASGGNAGIQAVCSGAAPLPPGCNPNDYVNPISLNMLMGSMTLVFSLRFLLVLVSILFTSPAFGWIIALLIFWGIIEFILMLIGAIVTYVRSIVGLAFLFGLAPIFVTFILFDRSKNLVVGYVNAVLGFFFQPVLLFAFLGFYATLFTNSLIAMLFKADYCYIPFLDLVLFKVPFWQPVNAQNNLAGLKGWIGNPPMDIVDVLYFLLLAHLGKNLAKFIEQLSQKITDSQGPGMVGGDLVGKWFANYIPGVKGRSPQALLADGISALRHKAKAASFDEEVSRRGIAPVPKSGGEGKGNEGGEGGGGGGAPRKATAEDIAATGLTQSQGRGAVLLGDKPADSSSQDKGNNSPQTTSRTAPSQGTQQQTAQKPTQQEPKLSASQQRGAVILKPPGSGGTSGSGSSGGGSSPFSGGGGGGKPQGGGSGLILPGSQSAPSGGGIILPGSGGKPSGGGDGNGGGAGGGAGGGGIIIPGKK